MTAAEAAVTKNKSDTVAATAKVASTKKTMDEHVVTSGTNTATLATAVAAKEKWDAD